MTDKEQRAHPSAVSARTRTRPVADACLIAAVAALVMVAQTDFTAPPRYDGAGYAVLARSLREGSGYRAIDHPDRPRHAHFPPGYPAFLALVWGVRGYSAVAAHVASLVCTVGATLASWFWFRTMYSATTANRLGLAVAVNWAWIRAGTGIQSEPLYELLGQLAVLLACGRGAGRGLARPIALGLVLAACMLTRQIALGLAAAVVLDLLSRRRLKAALLVVTSAIVLVTPWLAWMAAVGTSERTQAGLLVAGSSGLLARAASQVLFYLQRLPDQITGPFVEIATVFRGSRGLATIANLWAVGASTVVVGGWLVVLRRPRRRLAGLIPLLTLGLLLAWPYTEAGRFLVPLVPCLLVGALEGACGLICWLQGTLGFRLSANRVRPLVAMLLLATAIPYTVYSLEKGRTKTRDDPGRDFDRACGWLVARGDHPGPVLTRHPGEVFLATGRQALEVATSERPGETDASASVISESIARYGVAYLLVDRERYANAPISPLDRFVTERPDQVLLVWSSGPEPATWAIYATTR